MRCVRGCPTHTRFRSSSRDRLPLRRHIFWVISTVGIVCGVLCLLSGLCVIFFWTFVPKPSNTYPLVLRIGAVICALGVAFLLACILSLYRWQTTLGRVARTIDSASDAHAELHRKRGNIHPVKFPTYSSCRVQEEGTLCSVLKKDSSAYVSIGSVQPEKLKVVGVLHGTISATEISTTPSKGITPAPHPSAQEVGSESKATRHNRPLIVRDNYMRRSLPRFLIYQHPSKTGREMERAPKRSVLVKAGSDGLNLHEIKEPSQHKLSNPEEYKASKTSSGMDNSAELEASLNCVPHTPPAAQASLFNLPGAVPPAATPLDNAKPKQEASLGLERSASGKRFLVMNQSGQVISCTTLFDGGDTEEDSSGVGCRRLQNCTGWNFFPLFVDPDQLDGSVMSVDDGLTAKRSDADTRMARVTTEHMRSCTTADLSTSAKPNSNERFGESQGHDFITRILRFLHPLSHWKRAFTTRLKRDDHFSIESTETEDAQTLLPDVSAPFFLSDDSGANEKKSSKRHQRFTDNHSDRQSPPTEKRVVDPIQPDDNMDDLDVETSRKHTIVSNASVFSLPAIPPEMWSAERPVWIMGVPVSEDHWVAAVDTACDLILLKKANPAGSGDLAERLTTGSTSSVYAFHVKPPSRLKASGMHRLSHTPCGRARSLGRILFSDRQSTQT